MTDEMQQDAVDCAVQVRERGSGGGRRCCCFCPMRAVLEKKSGGGGARGRAEGGRTSSWVPFRPRARVQALTLGLPLRALAAVCGPRARRAKKRDGPAPAPPLAPPPPRRADPPHTPPLFSCRFSPPRPSTSTPSRRTSPPLSRRSLTRSTRPPGTAWWGATLVRGERRRGEVGGETGDQRVRGRARAWGAQPAPHGGFSLLFLFTPRLLRHPRDQALYLLLHRCVHGARRDEGRCCEGERENAAHDLPTCSHPPPFFFSLSRAHYPHRPVRRPPVQFRVMQKRSPLCFWKRERERARVPPRAGYPLRPELMESTFLLYTATGSPGMLRVGAALQNTLAMRNRAPCGFAAVGNVATGERPCWGRAALQGGGNGAVCSPWPRQPLMPRCPHAMPA
jgi:hypothetical protein